MITKLPASSAQAFSVTHNHAEKSWFCQAARHSQCLRLTAKSSTLRMCLRKQHMLCYVQVLGKSRSKTLHIGQKLSCQRATM